MRKRHPPAGLCLTPWLFCCIEPQSVMDAMSNAIEGAEVMLLAASLTYKESANVSRSHTSAVACSRTL